MEAMGNGEVGRKKKLGVEDYLDLIDDRTLPLTVSQLRQIIGMHGFRKIEAPKRILTEMVSTMELMDIHRSTLLDGVSGDACLTLKEVIEDLKSLNWQDCYVASLLTYGAAGTRPSSAGEGTVSRKRKRPKRSGKKAAEVDADNSIISITVTTVVAGSTTDCSSAET